MKTILSVLLLALAAPAAAQCLGGETPTACAQRLEALICDTDPEDCERQPPPATASTGSLPASHASLNGQSWLVHTETDCSDWHGGQVWDSDLALHFTATTATAVGSVSALHRNTSPTLLGPAHVPANCAVDFEPPVGAELPLNIDCAYPHNFTPMLYERVLLPLELHFDAARNLAHIYRRAAVKSQVWRRGVGKVEARCHTHGRAARLRVAE